MTVGEGTQISAEYFICFYLFWGRVSCSSGWPSICYAADLDLPISSLVLGLPVFATMPGLCSAGDLTQAFMYAKQTFYNQARSKPYISPITIFIVNVRISLAIYKNTMSSKLFLPNTRSFLWKVRFKSNLILWLCFVYFCWCMWS